MKPLTDQQEEFCHSYAERGVGRWAACRAGYAIENSTSQASRLLRDPRILARVREIRIGIARARCQRLEELLAKLEGIYDAAVENGKYAAATRAVVEQAKLIERIAAMEVKAGDEETTADASTPVVPAKAGIPRDPETLGGFREIPAFAGMTEKEEGMTEKEAGVAEKGVAAPGPSRPTIANLSRQNETGAPKERAPAVKPWDADEALRSCAAPGPS